MAGGEVFVKTTDQFTGAEAQGACVCMHQDTRTFAGQSAACYHRKNENHIFTQDAPRPRHLKHQFDLTASVGAAG